MRNILMLLATSWLFFTPLAHAQWVEDCRDGQTYSLEKDPEYGQEWGYDRKRDEYEEVVKHIEAAPIELRLGTTSLVLRRVGLTLTPAGVADGSHDTLEFGDLFYEDRYADQRQRIVNHELAHIWAFNHLCAFEDFARIGWESISDEGRSGVRKEGAKFPARDGDGGEYAGSKPQEDFAVSVESYIEDREAFAEAHPDRAEWLAKNLFTPSGCPTEWFCDFYEDVLGLEDEVYGPKTEEDTEAEIDEEDPGDILDEHDRKGI